MNDELLSRWNALEDRVRDAVVAIVLMGWKLEGICEGFPEANAWLMPDGLITYQRSIPAYTANEGSILLLVELMMWREYCLIINRREKGLLYDCVYEHRDSTRTCRKVLQPTLARALCLAACFTQPEAFAKALDLVKEQAI